MKKIYWQLGVASLMLILITACNALDKKAALIPKDAAFVVHLNTNSLSSKLSWEEIKKTNWFLEISRDQKDSLAKKIMEDPANSGMDTKEGFFVFGRKAEGGVSYAGFTGGVKDAATFEAFNKKISESSQVTSKDNLKTILFGDKGSVTWNDDKFLYLVQSNFSPSFKRTDSLDVYQPPPPANFHEIARRIFGYKKDSLLIDDDRFIKLLKDEGDMHFWSNAEGFSMDENLGLLSLLKTDVYFRETVTAATLSFEKGKIAMHARSYSNEEMQEVMKKYSGENIDASLIKRIPSNNVVGVLCANYKPEGLKQLLKLGGLDGLANSFLGKYDLTLDELVAASKGDLMIAVTDVGLKKKMVSLGAGMDSLPITSPTADILLSISVKNKAPFQKLAGIAQTLSESKEIPVGFSYKLNNELFVAGTNSNTIDQYLAGGNKDFPFLSRISGHPIVFYLDINKLMTSFNDQVKDTASNAVYRTTLEMFKDVIMTGGEFKDGAVVQNAELNLVDQNTNSLQQLNSYVDKLYSTRKKPF